LLKAETDDEVTYEENENANYRVSLNGTTNMPYKGGSETVTLTVDEMPAHTHKQADLKWGSNWLGYDGQWSASSTSTNTQSYTTAAAGGGLAHNNMPPYTIVYIWKRIEDPKQNTETTE
jgi:microcystin-dependent protein